ncbi:unnamed protein product (macronuclear) [Paramecium tetraurelia]|uniref:Hemicentin-1-like von Willebrand factor A domain-containing protein n=1 Tax=Paramecium tetraurelia TaxID=5888 RepID=A0D055_PARTE|nr:uncharacterized protein GSPATT00011974001 [Paramecium tetraurelia]CAK76422.1 unnamed protein product [Paramecium tetraurelia]|eukprot:XP_001443819.1 hypothetical protein (macronuclear) [Paramecium tetraurelia strain d4-2]
MVKKAAPKKQETKKAPIRRTRTISTLIKDNENIVHQKLGQTRSKSNGVLQKKITKQTQETKQKNVLNEKEKNAPKKNSNQKEEKQPIKDDTKQKKQPEVKDTKKPIQTRQKVNPVQKNTPKKSPVKKSTPKKTPVKETVAKEVTKPKPAEKKNEKEGSKSEKKVEEKSEKKNNDKSVKKDTDKSDKKEAEKSDKKVNDKSEKKPVEKPEKKANDKSEKKPVEKSDKKSDKKGKSEKKEQSQEQQEQKQTDSAKIPRRTESKAIAGIVDVVFCVDTTQSMSQFLYQTKNTVKEIIKNIKVKAQNEDISVKFGFVCYRDHPPQDYTYVTKIQGLCGEQEILDFIDQQGAQGGGDVPEAVLDGLYDAAKKIEWRDASHTPSLRYIFHVADAPPHGKEFSDQASAWPNGVPSGVTLDKVAHVINIREIHYRLINVNKLKLLDNMKKLFKEKFTNYEETELANAKEMDFRVSDMIIRELLPDVDYND